MKRTLQILLIAVTAFSLTLSALAVNADDYWRQDDNGNWYYDYDAYNAAVAGEVAAKDDEYVSQPDPVESAGTSDGSSVAVPDHNSGDDDRIPLGSYVDEAGNVFSPDGELLSPGTTPAVEPDADTALPGDVPDTQDAPADTPAETGTLVYRVVDLRSDSALTLSAGDTINTIDGGTGDIPKTPTASLKSLITMIFGEYTPVMTTATVTETVDNVTTTTLIDAVASGSAGVDYEWLAGVFLFGILLFCLMKLLGGVLK